MRPGRLPSLTCEHFARAYQPNIQPSNNSTLIISLWFIRCTHHQICSSRSAPLYTQPGTATPTGSISHILRENRCVCIWIYFSIRFLFIYDRIQFVCRQIRGSDTERVPFLLSACLSIGRRCSGVHYAPHFHHSIYDELGARSCHPNRSAGLCKSSRIYKCLPKCFRAAVHRLSPSMRANEPFKINMRNYISAAAAATWKKKK